MHVMVASNISRGRLPFAMSFVFGLRVLTLTLKPSRKRALCLAGFGAQSTAPCWSLREVQILNVDIVDCWGGLIRATRPTQTFICVRRNPKLSFKPTP